MMGDRARSAAKKGKVAMKTTAGSVPVGARSDIADKLYRSDNPQPAGGSGFRAEIAHQQEAKERAEQAKRSKKTSMQSKVYPHLSDE